MKQSINRTSLVVLHYINGIQNLLKRELGTSVLVCTTPIREGFPLQGRTLHLGKYRGGKYQQLSQTFDRVKWPVLVSVGWPTVSIRSRLGRHNRTQPSPRGYLVMLYIHSNVFIDNVQVVPAYDCDLCFFFFIFIFIF